MDSFVMRLPQIVIELVAFALAISVHESAHGWVAERLGDPTARWLGRITLNPIKHVDLFGTILFPLMLAVIGAPVIGWAKPVPFVSRNLRNQRWGPALVGVAGPVSNMLFAGAVTAVLLIMKLTIPGFRPLLRVTLEQGPSGAIGLIPPLASLLFWLAAINLVLAIFNLIPIPPLDGSHILAAVLPPRLSWGFSRVGPYGMLILFALLWTGFFGYILSPFMHALAWILLS